VGERPTAKAAISISETQESTEDIYSQLSKLDTLHKNGVLTDEEFDAAKKKLLDRLK
jgi:F0F1-type ATP synthase delta subunit